MKRWSWIVAGVALCAAAVLAIVVFAGGDSSDPGKVTAAAGTAQREGEEAEEEEREDGYFNPHKEAKFERANGGEADRSGPDNPAAEQVENRAFPRSYVNDKRSLGARKQYNGKPRKPARNDFNSAARFAAAADATPGSWTAMGPVTGNVPGEASQFFYPDTQTGPSTVESGRVTAMAIDPNCGKASAPAGAPCRLWIAAAGGGIWRTDDALADAPAWIAPPDDLPTNAFGSLAVDTNDASGNTIYAGSGEPSGSGDSEAGLGLYRSTDGGQSWALVPGSRDAALNRSIGSIAIKRGAPDTIAIGTAVARHGSSAVNGGRRTPPDAPGLGVYVSTDGGASFTRSTDLAGKTPPNPAPASSGVDWFQGGITKLQYDPNNAGTLYAGVLGYGMWRSKDGGTTWDQVFATMNPADTFGDRTEFDAVDAGGGKTRVFLGDASDDLTTARVWRTGDIAAIAGDPDGGFANTGWTELSDSRNGTNGFLAYNYCQNQQCGYDDFVVSPASQPGVTGHGNELWLGGSMQYDELPAYAGLPPRSNGRGVIRSTNATDGTAADVTWQDMSATLGDDNLFSKGMHPDQHAIVFNPADPRIAFEGSDGGVIRVDVRSPQDKSAACAQRRYDYDNDETKEPLKPDDLTDCQRLLKAIPSVLSPVNSGLNDIQFQSLSYDPANPATRLLGGTQDNGTFSFTGSPTWLESVGGDGGQSGWDSTSSPTYHNYFDATPEVNYAGDDPKEWLAIYDPLESSREQRSFYTPFEADPGTTGRAFTGLEHVWRTDDNGGDREFLEEHCNSLHRDASTCGDWKPMGNALTNGSIKDRGGDYVVATERAPSDKGTLWAATRPGRLWVTKNADAANPKNTTFNRIDTAATPGRFISGIAIDPADANHAWISYSGYGAYTPGTPQHVLEVRYDPSHDKRATFTDRSYDIGDQPVTGIERDAGTGDLFAATDFGVLRLPAGSTSWVRAGGGLPNVAVYGLTLAPDAHVLYAATHGRGAYSLQLP